MYNGPDVDEDVPDDIPPKDVTLGENQRWYQIKPKQLQLKYFDNTFSSLWYVD